MIFWTKKRAKNVPGPQNRFFLGQESEIFENMIPNFENFENHMKFAHDFSVLIGSDDFPNELTRFQNKAKTIWVDIQKHCKNAVTIKIWLFVVN